MKFDVVIANPPYNDSHSVGKAGDKRTMNRSQILPDFISKFSQWTKQDGHLLFLSTPGVGQYIEKNKMNIRQYHWVPSKAWAKPINAVWWYATHTKGNQFIHNEAANKVFKIKHYRRKRNEPCFFYDKMVGQIGAAAKYEAVAHHAAYLPPTEMNIKNFAHLMKFIAPFGKSLGVLYWLNIIRYLDYYWIDGLTTEITEQDIIDHYGLTDEDLVLLKVK